MSITTEYIDQVAYGAAVSLIPVMNTSMHTAAVDAAGGMCPHTLFTVATHSDNVSDKIFAYLGLMVLSFYINTMCLMAELLVMTHSNVKRSLSETLELCCHIFIGPISAIAFITRDSFSTVLFFACLWHFFNDLNPFRPSNIAATKLLRETRNPRVRKVHWLHWSLSMLYFFHHFWLATAKLALNENVLHMPGNLPIAGMAILAWLIGSGFTHLSLAMAGAEMRSAMPLRITGIVMRVVGDFVMIFECSSYPRYVEWAFLGGLDIIWWIVHLGLLIRLAYAKKELSDEELDQAMRVSEEATKDFTKDAMRFIKSMREPGEDDGPDGYDENGALLIARQSSDNGRASTGDDNAGEGTLMNVCRALERRTWFRGAVLVFWLLFAGIGFLQVHSFKAKLVAGVPPPPGSPADAAQQADQQYFHHTNAVSLTVMLSSLSGTPLVQLPTTYTMPDRPNLHGLPAQPIPTSLTSAAESATAAINASAFAHLGASCEFKVGSYWTLPGLTIPSAPPNAPPCNHCPSWCPEYAVTCPQYAHCATSPDASCQHMPGYCTNSWSNCTSYIHCFSEDAQAAATSRWLLQPTLFNADATSTLAVVTITMCNGVDVSTNCVVAEDTACKPIVSLSNALTSDANSAFGHSSLLKAVFTSAPAISAAVQDGTNKTLDLSMVSLPFGLLLLALCVKNVRLLIVTLLNIAGSLSAAVLIMSPIASKEHVSVLALPMMAAVALALNIDYSLFLFSRFAKEIADGEATLPAVVTTLGSSGYTVLVSGSSLCICFLCMLMIPVSTISTMGLSAAVTTFFAVSFALTLTPTLIFCCPSFFAHARFFGCATDGCCPPTWCCKPYHGSSGDIGIGVDTMRLDTMRSQLTSASESGRDDRKEERWGCWATLGSWVQGPFTAPLMVLLLAAVMAPFAFEGLPKLGYIEGFKPMLPRGVDATDAYDQLQAQLGVGSLYPSSLLLVPPAGVVMHNNSAWLSASCLALKRLAEEVTQHLAADHSSSGGDGAPYSLSASELSGPMISRGVCTSDGSLQGQMQIQLLSALYSSCDPLTSSRCDRVGAQATHIGIQSTMQPFSTKGQAWARAVRFALPRATSYNGVPVGQFYLLGKASQMMDAADYTFDSMGGMLAVILSLSVIIIAAAFRAALVPVRAILCLLWMLAIVFGAAALVYRSPGALKWLGDFVSPTDGDLFWMSPCIALPICIGLGLDYDIFFVETVVEFYDEGRSPVDAVLRALQQTGHIIAAAGAIMIVAFGALLLSPTPALNQTGFMLILGILCNCFITTKVFIPALMACVCNGGWANFWPRVPHGVKHATHNEGQQARTHRVDSVSHDSRGYSNQDYRDMDASCEMQAVTSVGSGTPSHKSNSSNASSGAPSGALSGARSVKRDRKVSFSTPSGKGERD